MMKTTNLAALSVVDLTVRLRPNELRKAWLALRQYVEARLYQLRDQGQERDHQVTNLTGNDANSTEPPDEDMIAAIRQSSRPTDEELGRHVAASNAAKALDRAVWNLPDRAKE